jgi:hypothetical protein
MLVIRKRASWALLAACCILLTSDTASAQGPTPSKQPQQHVSDSLEIKRMKTVERHFGTVGAGVFVILLGLAAVGRAVWMIRRVFQEDNIWYKIGVVLLICVGLVMIGMGVEITQQGVQGKSLDTWLNEL